MLPLTQDHPTSLIWGSRHVVWIMSRQVCFLSLGSVPVSIPSHAAQIDQASSKVNYGHSLHGGISLAVIAHSIPLPCASPPFFFFFFCPRFTLHWSMKQRCTPPHAENGNVVEGGKSDATPAHARIYQTGLSLGAGFKEDGGLKKSGTCGWMVQFHINSRKYRDYWEAERVCCVSMCMCIGACVFMSTMGQLFSPVCLWNGLVHVGP